MAMLRNDGDFVIFVIKHRKADGEWTLSSLDYFKFAGEVRTSTSEGDDSRREFSASGECWQRTGVTGTFDRKAGLAALAAISEANPGYEFGLFEVNIAQSSRSVATMALMP